MSNLDRFHLHLSLTKTSRSQARDRIFSELYRTGPTSIRDLAVSLNSKVGSVGRSTVYRTVILFVKLGVAQELTTGLFEITDRFKLHHHYFICRICGKRQTFNHQAIETAIDRLSKRGLKIEEHYLHLTGVCGLCSIRPGVKSRRAIETSYSRPPGL